jgi:hypothetical protein
MQLNRTEAATTVLAYGPIVEVLAPADLQPLRSAVASESSLRV